MKKLILFLFIVCVSCHSFAQGSAPATVVVHATYEWQEVLRMQACDINGTVAIRDYSKAGGATMTLFADSKEGQLFNVSSIDEAGKTAIIKIVKYTESGDFYEYNFNGNAAAYDAISEQKKNVADYDDRQLYWKVLLSDIEAYAIKEDVVAGGLSAGVINYTFKFRGQKGKQDFTGAFNFGGALGYTIRHKVSSEWTGTFLLGFSISNINIDTSAATRNQDKLQSINNFSAFSFSIGAMLEYHKIQVGVFIGCDRISNLNDREFDWNYQGRPWLSAGIGYAIFTPQKATNSAPESQ